jgi:hypothetical protein
LGGLGVNRDSKWEEENKKRERKAEFGKKINKYN